MNERNINRANVCVVGGAGFLGSHLVEYLIETRGCNVLVLDNLCVGRREFIHAKAHFEYCDITASEERLKYLINSYEAEYVFNYAAHPYVPMCYDRPLHVFETNATGAIKVINAAAETESVKGILQVSSAELYGETSLSMSDGRLDEDTPIAPHSTYGAAKAAVDYYCQVAWKERSTPVIALRQFNCVGERETHPYVIPEIIGQLAKQLPRGGVFDIVPSSEASVRLGNNSTRDFMYVGDAVIRAIGLLENGEFGEVYNLGSEESICIYELAERIGKLMGFESVTVEEDSARKRPWEIWHLQSNNSKINKVFTKAGLDYSKTSLDKALIKTIGWYTRNNCKWPWE